MFNVHKTEKKKYSCLGNESKMQSISQFLHEADKP